MLISLLKIALVAVTLAYLGFGLVAIILTPRLLFPVPPPSYEAKNVTCYLKLPDNTPIATNYHPIDGAQQIVIYHHGNGEDLGTLGERLEGFTSRGYATIGYDYPGYGRSGGKPSEASLIAAAEAVYRHVTGSLGWNAHAVVHYGHSLGGGPAIEMGMRHPSQAVVVEGTFTSVFRVMTRFNILPWDIFDNLKKVRHLQAPLLVIHGMEDTTVPFRHGSALFSTAVEADHLWVEGAHHANLWEVAGERFWNALAVTIAKAKKC